MGLTARRKIIKHHRGKGIGKEIYERKQKGIMKRER
jgi:hypothetical protein